MPHIEFKTPVWLSAEIFLKRSLAVMIALKGTGRNGTPRDCTVKFAESRGVIS
jgi:hypothetical protein